MDSSQTPARPVCIVGAGFPLGILENWSPSTTNIVRRTVEEYGHQFPCLDALSRLTKQEQFSNNALCLDLLWTNLDRMARRLVTEAPRIAEAYQQDSMGFPEPIRRLAARLSRQDEFNFLWTLLGIELKRMITMQYSTPRNLRRDLDELWHFVRETRNVTWISLNYDLVLENLLEECRGSEGWVYGFSSVLGDQVCPREGCHIVSKPHGSVNIEFWTRWAHLLLHQVTFADRQNRLTPVDPKGLGDLNDGFPREEMRPCIIGYVPEIMKAEVNSPGQFGDFGHDFCKASLSYSALSLQIASSLYVLGYSMPPEDGWVWSRLRALRDKSVPVYVASAQDSRYRRSATDGWVRPCGSVPTRRTCRKLDTTVKGRSDLFGAS